MGAFDCSDRWILGGENHEGNGHEHREKTGDR